jgi:hypothetical protein
MTIHPLQGVRIKIDRAKKHLADLVSEFGTFGKEDPYPVVREIEPDSGDEVYRVRIKRYIPPEWAGSIGDVIHCLRSAYDHLAVALVVANGKDSKTAIAETEFPVSSSKEAFHTKKVSRASDEAIRAIERLEPYKGGKGHAIWQIHKLDILDKHRVLIPVGMSYRGPIIGMRMDVPWSDKPVEFPSFQINAAEKVFPLEDGTELLRVRAAARNTPNVKNNYQFPFEIAFDEGQVRPGEPVGPALKEFIDFTENTVEIFRKTFFI